MIEINVLPQELRIKGQVKKFSLSSIQQPRFFLYLVPVILGVLLLMHLYLIVTNSVAHLQLNALNKKWANLGSQRKLLESEIKRNAFILQDLSLMQRVSKMRLGWSEKLTRISMGVPTGVWLTELWVAPEGCTLRGSAVSFEKQEINLINKFIDNLKNDESFITDFSGIELGSVQKKVVGGYEIVDFVLSANFAKSEESPNVKRP